MTDMLYGVAGSILTLAIVAVINAARTGSSLPRRVVRLEEISAVSLETQIVQTEGIIAIAEAVSGKRCNGNVDDALRSMEANHKKTVEFLASRVTGGPR